MNIRRDRKFDFSRGVQDATTWIMKQPNELRSGVNLNFNDEIGAFVRILGSETVGNAFASPAKTPRGGHTARFSNGLKRMVACNNAADTFTVVRVQDSGTGVWTDLITDYPVNSEVFFFDYLDEVYVTGYERANGNPLSPRNIDKTLNVSTSRNILGMPACHYVAEFAGQLYAINCTVGVTRYPNRAYQSSAPLGPVTYIRGAHTGVNTVIKVDSVRYLKAGMLIDVYTAGTSTKIYDITITSVDKLNNTITVPSATYTLTDNDEIWLDGRKDKLTIFWNNDYPTPEEAEFLEVLPGADSDHSLTAAIKSNNRLFLFTKNSAARWDGAQLGTFSNSVGCISHRSLKNLEDDWMIWLDAKGNVRARNEASGQQENISRAIRKLMRKVPQSALKESNAVTVDNLYKLYLGTVEGYKVRVVYDFESNTWSPERRAIHNYNQVTDDYTGYIKPYYFSDDGKLYIDETGNLDAGKVISFEGETGKDMFGTEQLKKFWGVMVFSDKATGMKVMCSVDNSQFISVGQIEKDVQLIKFAENGDGVLPRGVAINTKVVGAIEGDPSKVEGLITYWIPEEDVPSERR